MTIADLVKQRRPHRVDAQRNYDALVAAAREAFTEQGINASLEDVARRAGVGVATLYRNFPTREELIETVYVEEVMSVCRYGDDLAGLDPWDALVAWLHRFARYVGTKQALIDGLNRESPAFEPCRDALYGSGGPLLRGAQASGEARNDVDIDDVMRFFIGISAVNLAEESQQSRLFAMGIDGLRHQSA